MRSIGLGDPMTTPRLDVSLGELAARQPEAIDVLERFGLDYCCGGRQTLGEACEAGQVDPAVVQAALAALAADAGVHWAEAPLPALVAHLLVAFHAPHRLAFAHLRQQAATVVEAHRVDPVWGPRLASLAACLGGLADELEHHMQKEERVLFPWICGGQGRNAGAPVRVLLSEHEHTAHQLRTLRALAADYQPPAGACTTLTAFFAGLAGLERALHEHMHLENNVLFPRALAG